MAQTTILASGTSAATSTPDVVLTDGQTRTIGLFAAGALGNVGGLKIMIDTPSADLEIGTLSRAQPVVVLCGPGTFRVVRSLGGDAVGVFMES